jgi:subtilisin family serine protease
MKNIFKSQIKFSIIVASFFIFTACGGGGGGGSSSNETDTSTTTQENTAQATDYSKYAWNINESIDSNYKSTYKIDDNAHINLSAAWNTTKGKKSNAEAIKVAIIDEGFEVSHPEIKDQIFATYNVMTGTTDVSNTSTSTFSHGTAVAGVIASKYLGVAPEAQLILINIDLLDDYQSSSTLTEADLITAFQKAVDLGAQVINCSWGGGTVSGILSAKIQELKDNNITVVFSAGNDSSNLDSDGTTDESELSSVIGVGASSVENDITSYSNYGSQIDLIAPAGGNTTDGLLGVLSLDLTGTNGINTSTQLGLVNYNYSFVQGTSFSAPTVSGVVALLLAAKPTLTANEIRQILIDTADKVGTSNGADYSVNNFDVKRAYGKINAGNAVTEALK